MEEASLPAVVLFEPLSLEACNKVSYPQAMAWLVLLRKTLACIVFSPRLAQPALYPFTTFTAKTLKSPSLGLMFSRVKNLHSGKHDSDTDDIFALADI